MAKISIGDCVVIVVLLGGTFIGVPLSVYHNDHNTKARAWEALPAHVKQARNDEKHRRAVVYQILKMKFQTECISSISNSGRVTEDALEECGSVAWRNAEKIVKLGIEDMYLNEGEK